MRRRAPPTSYMEEVCRLISRGSGSDSTAGRKNAPLSAQSLYQGCKRLSGPPLPPAGTPTATHSLERLNERLEHLAFAPRAEGGPPLVTYTTTTSEHGDVVRATEAYIEWFRRTYPAAGRADMARVPPPGPGPKGAGREGRWKQNDLTPSVD